ncbi:MAG: aminoacyl-tRNA hydrolase [Nitrospirae bacterium]|nr:aminoacyl-tRNA hydrolase [Nitrospirota bacterium]
MVIIVGLGNPGRKYHHTRHNVGFRVVDHLAAGGRKFKKNANGDLDLSLEWEGRKLLLLKPQTYMNLSGEAVAGVLQRGRDRVIAVCDDLNLPLGNIRVRKDGSDGGHKGLRSLIEHLGTDEFVRVRVGIGRPDPGQDVVDFVLKPPKDGEDSVFEAVVQTAAEAVRLILADGVDAAMNRFNRRATQ